eukprot:scaffold115494_cov63-Phaeocystis_antarctica.AAC.2
MLREVCVDDRPWLGSPEGFEQWLVCQVLDESFLTVPGSSLGSEALSVYGFRVSQALGPTPTSGSSQARRPRSQSIF